MCPTEVDRERLVATVSGVGRARAVMFVVLAGVVVASAPQTGWWPLAVASLRLEPFRRLLAILQRPYDHQPEAAEYTLPPPPSEQAFQTFCGT